jgi:hypothetical protein
MALVGNKVCVSKRDLYTYSFILVLVIAFVGYVLYVKYILPKDDLFSSLKLIEVKGNNIKNNDNMNFKISELQRELSQCNKLEDMCQDELMILKQQKNLLSLYNKQSSYITSPNREYINPSNRQLYNAGLYQLVGFVYNNEARYPLYGRYKDPGRSDRWEYYVIDESRNKLKMPFRSRNDYELVDGEIINIEGLGDNLTVKIYEIEKYRYDPYF